MKKINLFSMCYIRTGIAFSLIGSAMLTMPSFAEETAEEVPQIETISLPAPRQDGGVPLFTALKNRHTSRDFSEKTISQQVLADLLWAAFGVNRADSGMRTAPSSYNWQDIIIYVFTADGVWTYDAPNNQLLPAMSGDQRKLAGMQGYVATAPLSFVYVSDYTKMTHGDDVYSDEYKLMMGCLDAGHISENVYLFCSSEGLGCVARASVDRDQFAKAFKLPETMKVIFGQTVGYPSEDE